MLLQATVTEALSARLVLQKVTPVSRIYRSSRSRWSGQYNAPALGPDPGEIAASGSPSNAGANVSQCSRSLAEPLVEKIAHRMMYQSPAGRFRSACVIAKAQPLAACIEPDAAARKNRLCPGPARRSRPHVAAMATGRRGPRSRHMFARNRFGRSRDSAPGACRRTQAKAQ